MDESISQTRYRDDAGVLAALGAAFARADLRPIEVHIPHDLADRAVAAWARDEHPDDGPPETFEQRVQRHRAAALALIGLAVTERGRRSPDGVTVELPADLVGVAIDAADDLPVCTCTRFGCDFQLAAADVLADELVEVEHDAAAWQISFRCPRCERRWLRTYPDSGAHGGGIPRMTVVLGKSQPPPPPAS